MKKINYHYKNKFLYYKSNMYKLLKEKKVKKSFIVSNMEFLKYYNMFQIFFLLNILV